MKTKTLLAGLTLGLLLITSACAELIVTPLPPLPSATIALVSPSATQPPASLTPILAATRRATITIAPTVTDIPVTVTQIYNPAGTRVTFTAEDGQQLNGTYYIAPKPKSPVIVLMQDLDGNQTMWAESQLIIWLQNASSDINTEMGETLPPGVNFNVLTFDFRGQNSGKPPKELTSEQKKQYLLDAKAAYDFAATLPYANPKIIVGLGVGIGADAAMDACGQNCAGAFGISPTSSLGVNWYNAVIAAVRTKKQTRCMAASNDRPASSTCKSIPTNDYYSIYIFDGKKHGMDFLAKGRMEPDFGLNLGNFLMLVMNL